MSICPKLIVPLQIDRAALQLTVALVDESPVRQSASRVGMGGLADPSA
jgi:hypothetical protein